MNYKERALQDIKKMEDFDVMFEEAVETIILNIESAVVLIEVSEDDSKQVKAHKNAKARKVKNVISRCIRDLNKSITETVDLGDEE